MKRKVSKILATMCCVSILLSVFSFFASAHTFNTDELYAPHGEEPVVENYKWETIDKVVSVQQTENYFIMHTETENHAEDLYLSFPVAAGGFRIQSKHEYQEELEVSNVGLFEPVVADITYVNADNAVVMKSTDDTIVKYIQNGTDFQLDIYNGTKLITRIENGQIHFGYSTKVLNKDEIVATMVEMPMDYENEAIYNGSQRYCDVNVVGEHFSLTNNDCYSAEDYAYGNIPLFHSNTGYSLWFNMTYPGEANFGCDQDDTVSKEKYSITFYGDKLDFFIWTGEPLENLKKYTRITGTSGMTEEWTFGFWTGATGAVWKDGGAYANMTAIMNGYQSRYGFYPEAIYSEGAFNDEQSASYLESINVRSLDWVWAQSRDFSTYLNGVSKLPSKKNGSTGWPLPFNSLGLKLGNFYVNVNSQYADCSNPSMVTYLTNYFTSKWNAGVAGAMLDMNESMSFVGTCFNGLSSMEMHNFNSYYYAKYGREAWEANYPGLKNDYVLFQRSAAPGTQYYVSGFQGDQRSTWAGYKAAVRDMISRSAGGFNLFGADLGGLGGTPSNDLWNRWVVLSVFQPYMRQHGNVIHQPWNYGTVAEKNFGKLYYLRKNIVPSIMSAAVEANRTANPIVKGMMMAYPQDRSLKDVNYQYLFCDDYLVCAVTEEARYYLDVTLPAGNTWYNLFSYEALAGRTNSYRVEAPNNWMPVYLKDGSVKAINLPESKTLMDNMPNTATEYPSLLITPPDAGNGRQSVIYNKDGQSDDFRTFDYNTEVYENTPVDDATFTVTNREGSDRQTVLALGVVAYEVSVDGTKLSAVADKANLSGTNYGYYVDADGLTTIYLPTGWKELKVVKGNSMYSKLSISSVKWSTDTWTQLYDEDLSTVVGNINAGTQFTIDLGSSQRIGRVVLKWLANYSTEYTIAVRKYSIGSYSDVKTVTDGDGGLDVLDISAEGRYIRVTINSSGISALTEVEVYAPVATTVTKADAGTATCTNGHNYNDGDICASCGYVRTAVLESVTDGHYAASVRNEDNKEVRAGTLLFTNMRGEVAVPVRIGFRQTLDSTAGYTVPDGFNDEGIEVTYETISPTLENPNIGHLGNSFNSTLGGLRFVSRFTYVTESETEYLLLDGKKYEVVDYGMLMSSRPGLDTTSDRMTDEQAMVISTSNSYVKKLSVKEANRFFDKCDAHIDMAVTVTGLHKVQGYINPEQIDLCSRAYVTIKGENGATVHLYGNVAECSFADVAE